MLVGARACEGDVRGLSRRVGQWVWGRIAQVGGPCVTACRSAASRPPTWPGLLLHDAALHAAPPRLRQDGRADGGRGRHGGSVVGNAGHGTGPVHQQHQVVAGAYASLLQTASA